MNVKFTNSEALKMMLAELKEVDDNDYKVADLSSKERERTSDEIGTGHIDNDRPDIQLEGFDSAP
jgi:hypothetical protein